VLGWKGSDAWSATSATTAIICSSNLDPMGVHTGDPITIAPALTYRQGIQIMRVPRSRCCADRVETGGSNVQFAVNPEGAWSS
jgi:carbamoylphosphate synthase large subunit